VMPQQGGAGSGADHDADERKRQEFRLSGHAPIIP
jgi:hypothetical protein